MNPLKLLIVGAPGSGKGTISKRIAAKFDFYHFSSGDKLREQIDQNTELAKEIRPYMSNGQLVPDRLFVSLVMSELKSIGNRKVLLDGFPRTRTQAMLLSESGFHLTAVINIRVPYPIIIERLANRWIHLGSGRVYNLDFNAPKTPGLDDITGEPLVQREDDKPAVVEKRLNDYDSCARDLIEHYKQQRLLVEFAGHETNTIWPKVEDFLRKLIALNKNQSGNPVRL